MVGRFCRGANAGSWDKAAVAGSSLGWRLPGQQLTLELCTGAVASPEDGLTDLGFARGFFAAAAFLGAGLAFGVGTGTCGELDCTGQTGGGLHRLTAKKYKTKIGTTEPPAGRRKTHGKRTGAAPQHRFPGRSS